MSISIKMSLKFIPKGPIDNIPSLVQIMAWRRPGDKPLSEPMMFFSLTYMRHSAAMRYYKQIGQRSLFAHRIQIYKTSRYKNEIAQNIFKQTENLLC